MTTTKKIRVDVALEKDQHIRLKAIAASEERSIREMARILLTHKIADYDRTRKPAASKTIR